jgi:hypothetical protein
VFLLIEKWDLVVYTADPEALELWKNPDHWRDVRLMYFKKGVRYIDPIPSLHATLQMELAFTVLHEALRLPFHSTQATMACLAQHQYPLFIIHHTIFLSLFLMLHLGL